MPNYKPKIVLIALVALGTASFLWWNDARKDQQKVDLIIKDATIITMNETGQIIERGWIVQKKSQSRIIRSKRLNTSSVPPENSNAGKMGRIDLQLAKRRGR